MKHIFALPGILLPLTILAVGVFIGNSAFDIKIHDEYLSYGSTDLSQAKFDIPLLISWVFYIALEYIKPPSKKLAWLHVVILVICVFIFYYSLDVALPGAPRRYYDYSVLESYHYFMINNAKLSVVVVVFYLTQIIFWIHCLIVIVKRTAQKRQ